jgi:hypothetical protein
LRDISHVDNWLELAETGKNWYAVGANWQRLSRHWLGLAAVGGNWLIVAKIGKQSVRPPLQSHALPWRAAAVK